jgi:hypothetical protein
VIFGTLPVWQAWVLLAALGAAASWLFFLKVRPPRVVVSSLALWHRALNESRAVSWWERARRAVSFVVALVTTLALALALLRPALRPAASGGPGAATGSGAVGPARPTGRLLIVLDSSWSMLARTRSGDTRWDRAVAEAKTLAATGGDEVALATTADGLVEGPTPDVSLIDAALDRISASGGEAGAWPRLPGVQSVHFITDGAVARRLDPAVIIHSVFEAAPNVAITAFDVRPTWQGDQAADAYLEVANYAAVSQRVHVALTRGTATVFDRHVDMAAGEAIRQIVPLDRDGDPRLRAHVDAPNNALVVDDEAVAWIRSAQPLTVTIVSNQPAPFALLLQRDPDVRATVAQPSAYRPGDEDVVIFDRWLPPDPPGRPALCLAPPATSWLGAISAEEPAPRWTTGGSHPVLRGVDPMTLTIERARAYGGADLMPVARSDKGTPLVYVADSPQRRLVLVTFSAGESNLPFAPAFPVLVANALEWLARPESSRVRRPGTAMFEGNLSRLVAPNGKEVTLTRVGGVTLGELRAPGLYVAEAGGSRSVLAVNIGDPEASNLLHTSANATDARAVTGARLSRRPWWLVCAALAFGLLAVEWWTWQRRITV